MPIVRWEPFRDLALAQDRFNRLFNETLSRAARAETGTGTWAPAVDIREADQNLVLTVQLPGVNPNDVDVRLENNTLYLKGERKLEGNEQSYHQIERVYGPFARAFTLPDSVDPNNVVAEFKDGVLSIKLAKREEAKPRTVKIQVGGREQKTMAAGVGTQS
jgi:HSP20 family protein